MQPQANHTATPTVHTLVTAIMGTKLATAKTVAAMGILSKAKINTAMDVAE
jgi:hypothetical protein